MTYTDSRDSDAMADDDVIRFWRRLVSLAAAAILAKMGKSQCMRHDKIPGEIRWRFSGLENWTHQRTSLKKWSNGGWTRIHSNQPISQRWH